MGDCKHKSKTKHPAIIDVDTYRKAQEMMTRNLNKPKKVYKHTYLGKGILKDASGYSLVSWISRGKWHYRYNFITDCRVCITAAPVDASLWYIAREKYGIAQDINKLNGVDKTKKQIDELTQKIQQAEKNIAELTDKIDRVEERYIAGKISSVKADSMGAEFRKHIEMENRNIVKFSDQIRQLEAPIDSVEGMTANIETITDNELRHKIIKMVIDHVTITRENRNTANLEVHYNPLFANGDIVKQTFTLITKRGQQKLRLANDWEISLKEVG